MGSSKAVVAVLAALAFAAYACERILAYPFAGRVTLSLSFAAGFMLLRVIVEDLAWSRMKGPARYTMRKAFWIAFWIALLVAVIRVWVVDRQVILFSYGVLAAGIAFAVQDLLRSFASGIVVLVGEQYRVGDRIEIGGVYGDVLDIGLLTTSVLEMRGWVAGDQATGRIAAVPNSAIWQGVQNYTRDNRFIWDEITLPITYASDWKRAMDVAVGIASEATSPARDAATAELSRMHEKYYFSERTIQPSAYVRATDNWIELSLRYITPVEQRREIFSEIHAKLVEAFAKDDALNFSSATYDIVGFPPIRKAE